MSGDWLAMGAVGALVAAGAASRRRGSAVVDLSSLDLVEHQEAPGPGLEPVHWATGVPVTFRFARNTEPSPWMGARYAQDVEPAGRFVTVLGVEPDKLPPGLIAGEIRFTNPIVLASVWPIEGEYSGAEGWKHKLSRAFGGKRGLTLTKALRAAGYDGIVTVTMPSRFNRNRAYLSEIVDLTTMGRPGKPRRGAGNTALVRRVQGELTPDLLSEQHRGTGRGKTAGHCYVASQALWHLLGGSGSGYTPQVGPAPGGGTHWWLRQDRTGRILDPTADQFPSYDYGTGTGKGFLTAEPSKRARVLIDRVRKGSRSGASLHAMKLSPWTERLQGGIEQLRKAVRQGDPGKVVDGIDDVSFWTGRVVCDVLGAAEHAEVDRKELATAGKAILVGQGAIMQAKAALRKRGSGARQQQFNDAFWQWFGKSKVVDKRGEPLLVFHGSPAEESFEAFDLERVGQQNPGGIKGFFFGTRPATANAYRPNDYVIKPEHRQRFEALHAEERKAKQQLLNAWNAHYGTSYPVDVPNPDTMFLKDAQDQYVYDEPDHIRKLQRYERRVGEALWAYYEDQDRSRPQFWRTKKQGQLVMAYLSLQDPLIIDAGGEVWSRDFEAKLKQRLAETGEDLYWYDGLILKNFYDGEVGVRDDIYVAFRPEQIKSVENRGTWDPDDPRMSFNRRTR